MKKDHQSTIQQALSLFFVALVYFLVFHSDKKTSSTVKGINGFQAEVEEVSWLRYTDYAVDIKRNLKITVTETSFALTLNEEGDFSV